MYRNRNGASDREASLRRGAGEERLFSGRSSWSREWGAILFLTLFVLTGSIEGQIADVDLRRVDTIILLDVSGSMVFDVRRVLLKEKLASGKIDVDSFPLKKNETIAGVLCKPRVEQVATNNLLFQSVRYLEGLIDRHERGRIYLATFDNGLRILSPEKIGAYKVAEVSPCVPDGMMGPFIFTALDADSDAGVKQRIKSFLDPFHLGSGLQDVEAEVRRKFGPLPGPEQRAADPKLDAWMGVFPEAVLKGSGPTSLHETCLLALKLLQCLRDAPGYTNETKRQNLIVLTDGLEQKDKKTPFSQTVERFRLHKETMPFEFRLVYILPENESPPPQISEINYLLQKEVGGNSRVELFSPRSITVKARIEGTVLSGRLREPENHEGQSSKQETALSPNVRFAIEAEDKKPVKGKLVFSVTTQGHAEKMKLDVVPREVQISDLSQAVSLTLAIEGGLSSLFASDSQVFDELSLTWELVDARDALTRQVRKVTLQEYKEPSLLIRGDRTLPIELHLLHQMSPVVVRGLRPAKPNLAPGERVDVQSAPQTGEVASFQTDFGEGTGKGAVLVRLTKGVGSEFVHLKGTPGNELLLTKEPAKSKQEFTLTADAPAGTHSAVATLDFIPQREGLSVSPTNIEVRAEFEPSVVKIGWFGSNEEIANQPADQPANIDLGIVYFSLPKSGMAGEAKAGQPPTNSFSLEIPDKAVSPAIECVIVGENPEVFCLTSVSQTDSGALQGTLFDHSMRLQIQPQYVCFSVESNVVTNLSARLEIRPKGNFIFETRRVADVGTRTQLVTIPLRMKALVQRPEGFPKGQAPK